MTPSTKPTTRLTSAWVRDMGMRQVVATIVGGVLELRAKGRKQTEVLDISTLYFMAVKARVLAAKAAKKKARKKPK